VRTVSRGILLGFVGLGLVCQPVAAGALKTDLSKALVPLDEIVSGGPPPDGIPAIDRPVFVATGTADAWLKPAEPVLALQVNGDARSRNGDVRLIRFITLMFRAFRPEIEALQDAKERAIQRYRATHGGADPFENRSVEILSQVEIDFPAYLGRTTANREATG